MEAVARAVLAGDRLWFRLVCRRWAAAGAEVAPVAGKKALPAGKVTRTCGPDAAASVARAAEVMVGVFKGPRSFWGQKKFKNYLCQYSANGGHLEVFQWARANGCPWDEMTCAYAAEGGHLEVLQWARAHGCPWYKEMCAWAAKNGQFDLLQWARANGCP